MGTAASNLSIGVAVEDVMAALQQRVVEQVG